MCIFIVCVLKCTYIQQSSCKLSQLQPNQTKPSCCNISWMIQNAVKHHGSTNQCELCFQIPLSVCVGKDVGRVEGGGWKPGRWHGRGAAEADVALGKFNAIGYDEKVLGEVGIGQCDIRGIHEGRGDFKQVGNVTHALLQGSLFSWKISFFIKRHIRDWVFL